MTSKHTAGPWWTHLNSAGSWEVLTLRDDPHRVEEGSGYGAYICTAINDPTEARTRFSQEANARLIAAAPELLEALQMVEDAYRDHLSETGEHSIPYSPLAKIRAAITKATGGEL